MVESFPVLRLDFNSHRYPRDQSCAEDLHNEKPHASAQIEDYRPLGPRPESPSEGQDRGQGRAHRDTGATTQQRGGAEVHRGGRSRSGEEGWSARLKPAGRGPRLTSGESVSDQDVPTAQRLLGAGAEYSASTLTPASDARGARIESSSRSEPCLILFLTMKAASESPLGPPAGPRPHSSLGLPSGSGNNSRAFVGARTARSWSDLRRSPSGRLLPSGPFRPSSRGFLHAAK